MPGVVLMLACGLCFLGGMVCIMPTMEGKRLGVSLIGFAMGLASYFWLYTYFIKPIS